MPSSVLPSCHLQGATEQHGPHAPLGTDTFVAEQVFERTAELVDVLRTPTMPGGYSPQHMDWPGSLTLTGPTFERVIGELLDSCIHHGFREIVVISGHGGNRAPMDSAVRHSKVRWGNKVRLVLVDMLTIQAGEEFRRKVEKQYGQRFGPLWEAHGGEQETSMAMAYDLNLVDLTGDPDFIDLSDHLANTRSPAVWEVDFGLKRHTACGYWGDPRGATAEQGAVIIEVMAQFIVEQVRSRLEER